MGAWVGGNSFLRLTLLLTLSTSSRLISGAERPVTRPGQNIGQAIQWDWGESLIDSSCILAHYIGACIEPRAELALLFQEFLGEEHSGKYIDFGSGGFPRPDSQCKMQFAWFLECGVHGLQALSHVGPAPAFSPHARLKNMKTAKNWGSPSLALWQYWHCILHWLGFGMLSF